MTLSCIGDYTITRQWVEKFPLHIHSRKSHQMRDPSHTGSTQRTPQEFASCNLYIIKDAALLDETTVTTVFFLGGGGLQITACITTNGSNHNKLRLHQYLICNDNTVRINT